MTEPDTSMYCRTCRKALARFTTAGVTSYRHKTDIQGIAEDHRPDPVLLTELADPQMECDFCSTPDPVCIYVCGDIDTDTITVTSRAVSAGEYQRRHHAARSTVRTTGLGPLNRWGERWGACAGCAALVDARDLLGLVRRVADALPTKVTRGNKLVRVRGELTQTYGEFFATLLPGRNVITPEHPLGLWQDDDTGHGTDG